MPMGEKRGQNLNFPGRRTQKAEKDKGKKGNVRQQHQ